MRYRELSDRTIKTYSLKTATHPILPHVHQSIRSGVPLHKLLNPVILELSQKYSPAYVHSIIAFWRSYLSYLNWIGIDFDMRWEYIIKPKKTKTKIDIFTGDEIARIIQYRNEEIALLSNLSYTYALRIGEVRNLSVRHFSDNFKKITITGEKKGKTVTYLVPNELRTRVLRFLKKTARDDIMFPYSSTIIYRQYTIMLDELKIKNRPFRVFRHTRIANEMQSLLKMQLGRYGSVSSVKKEMTSGDMNRIKSVGRHHSLEVAVDVYGHI